MKKELATLIAGLFTSAAFAQASFTPPPAEPAKAAGTHPVKASIKPEPDISATKSMDAKAKTKKAEKHKKTKTQKNSAKSDTSAESKTGPVPETK